MDNASLSRKSPQASELAVDEIPEAVRDNPYLVESQASQSKRKWLVWKLIGLGVVAFGASIWLHLNFDIFPALEKADRTQQNPAATSASPALDRASKSKASNAAAGTPDNLLGHLPYQEAPAKDLVAVTADSSVKLRTAAAAKYQEMANAAAAEGIYFAPISGFRSRLPKNCSVEPG